MPQQHPMPVGQPVTLGFLLRLRLSRSLHLVYVAHLHRDMVRGPVRLMDVLLEVCELLRGAGHKRHRCQAERAEVGVDRVDGIARRVSVDSGSEELGGDFHVSESIGEVGFLCYVCGRVNSIPNGVYLPASRSWQSQ